MKIMRKLSDFKDEKGIVVASRLLSIIMRMLSNESNSTANGKTPIEMFSQFMSNNPAEMQEIFAILSEKEPEQYHCDGTEAMMNMMVLANDPVMISLFTSQGRKTGAKSSASASENTED